MGADPKPRKRKPQTTRSLPLLPSNSRDIPKLQASNSPHSPSAYQTRLPDGPQYDTVVTLPSVAQLVESIAGIEDDGYFKLTPGNDGKSWYLTYKYRWGRWEGHYSMAVVARGDLHHGFVLLAEKVARVRAGLDKPTLDRYRG